MDHEKYLREIKNDIDFLLDELPLRDLGEKMRYLLSRLETAEKTAKACCRALLPLQKEVLPEEVRELYDI